MSLANVKRRMQVGQKIQLVQHDWLDTVVVGNLGNTRLKPSPGMMDVREVVKVTGKAIQFSNQSWLDWPTANRLRETANGFEVSLADDKFTHIMRYEYR